MTEPVTLRNPVQVSDLVARFRPLTPQETTNAEAWLVDAWEEVLGKVPNLQARVASGQLRDGQIVRVVAAMVVRVLRNPEALKAWQVDGDSFTRDNLVASGLLFISDEEISLLAGTTTSKAGAFTIRPARQR